MNLPFTIPTVPPRLRRPLLYVGYSAFAFAVAVLTLFGALPRDRIKDRLEASLASDPSPSQPLGIGMDVTINELGLTLFSGPGIAVKDAVLKSRPLDSSAKPTKWFVDDATVHFGVLGMLFNRYYYSWVGHALKGEVRGKFTLLPTESHLKVKGDGLVLNGVQAVQQALMGLPLEGTLSAKVEVDCPRLLLSDAGGSIEFTADDLAVGDGKAKLTIPNDPLLAAGLTVPKIRLGKLEGHITIEHGRAHFDDVRLHSADADATIEGYVELHDPLQMSQIHAYLRVRPSEQLVKREPMLDLAMNGAQRAKRSDGYLGFSVTGSFSMPSFLPSTEPPPGLTTRNAGPGPSHTVPPPPTTRNLPPPPPAAPPAVAPPPPPAVENPPPPPPPQQPAAVENPPPAQPPPAAPAPSTVAPPPAVAPPAADDKDKPDQPNNRPLRILKGGEHAPDDKPEPDQPKPAE